MIKPEILSPAGDMERLIAAVEYGADAVYLGGKMFGMRAGAANFDYEQLKEAVEYAHAHGVRIYVTCNTLPRNDEIEEIPEFMLYCQSIGVDALIVADIGILMMARRTVPNMEIHISTQNGVVNYQTANELHALGAKRVVLARELSLEEIRTIRQKTHPDLEIEAFVHGAMCMSFSGRCVISNYLTGRDANRGECSQPCRWGYHLVEEKRPGVYIPVFEDEAGSHILNAKDLCMIEYIDQLVDAGITSLKIEGRAKSFYYVAVITGAYRQAVDLYLKDPANYKLPQWLYDETYKISHREYSTGFYFGKPMEGQCYKDGGYVREWDVVATVAGNADGYLEVVEKNRFFVGDKVEIFEPMTQPEEFTITEIIDPEGNQVDAAVHPQMIFKIPFHRQAKVGAIIRKQKQ